jgi:hypothetical protein
MSEKEFREKYASLKLDSHKWKLMPVMAMRENWIVLVSIIKEIDLDALYYYYKTNMYKVDLNQQHHFWADNLREKIRKCIENKEDVIVSVGPVGQVTSSPIRYNPGGKGQALIELRIFGDFVFADSDFEELEEGVDKSSAFIEKTKESVEPVTVTVLDKLSEAIAAKKKEHAYNRNIHRVFSGKISNGGEIDRLLNTISYQEVVTEENILEVCALLLTDITCS